MRRFIGIMVLAAAWLNASASNADDEIALFSSQGKPSAYVALDEALTIYLWSGKPVAYLERDSGGGYNIYGFNGKHLGWFVGGIARDHDGNASCAVKERMPAPEFEPFKAFKQFKPFKSFKEFAPFRPFFSTSWSDAPCQFFLAEGAD